MISAPPRPSTTEPTPRAPPRQVPPPQQKAHKPADSLLGLDFFGSTQPSAGSRPSSTASTPAAPTGMSRPDLKQSILSLYSKPQPAPVQHARNNSFGDLASPPATSTTSNMGGLTDAFSGLSFPTTTSPPPAKPTEKPSPFANLANFSNTKSTPAAPRVTSPLGSASGDLFDSLTSPTLSAHNSQSRNASISSGQDFGFGGFASPTTKPAKPNPPSSSLSNDLFGMSSPPPAPAAPAAPPKPTVSSPQLEMSSAFNLSSPPIKPSAPAKPTVPVATAAAAGVMSASMDPWGGNAWGTPDPVPAPAPVPSTSSSSNMMKLPDTLTANDIGSGWGAPSKPTPTVAADEDFGGWTSAAPVSSGTTSTATSKPAGGFGAGSDDLFSNVWE